jgi:ubiquitin carboxyl-terminal hydrolase 9/24
MKRVLDRIEEMEKQGSVSLRNKWGFQISLDGKSDASSFGGLRNQGCTCYMNSLLQQLFMMKDLRKSLCDAPIGETLRGIGNPLEQSGAYLIGKRLSLQWENGTCYEAECTGFSDDGMHTIRYLPTPPPEPRGISSYPHHSHATTSTSDSADEIAVAAKLDEVDVELFLVEGRHGKETGSFQLVGGEGDATMAGGEGTQEGKGAGDEDEDESESDAAARRMLEELQRTFVCVNANASERASEASTNKVLCSYLLFRGVRGRAQTRCCCISSAVPWRSQKARRCCSTLR